VRVSFPWTSQRICFRQGGYKFKTREPVAGIDGDKPLGIPFGAIAQHRPNEEKMEVAGIEPHFHREAKSLNNADLVDC
jgi:hypothetical protein